MVYHQNISTNSVKFFSNIQTKIQFKKLFLLQISYISLPNEFWSKISISYVHIFRFYMNIVITHLNDQHHFFWYTAR